MVKCLYHGCNAKKNIVGGYCRNHLRDSTDEDAASLEERLSKLEKENKKMKGENSDLKHQLKESNEAIVQLYKHVNNLLSSSNNAIYQQDEQNQYGRKESWRLNDYEELPLKFDEKGNIKDEEDCKDVAIEAAKLVGVDLERKDIQRAHRVGKRRVPKRGDPPPKPRQVIVKLMIIRTSKWALKDPY